MSNTALTVIGILALLGLISSVVHWYRTRTAIPKPNDQQLHQTFDIEFRGGIEARLLTDRVIEAMRSVKTKFIWLAYDDPTDLRPLEIALAKLTKCFYRNILRVYVLIGYAGDTIDAATARLHSVYHLGALPFAMLYQGPDQVRRFDHAEQWRNLAALFSQPKYYRSIFEKR